MHKGKAALASLFMALSISASGGSEAAAQPIRGDYDNDGLSDLAVGLANKKTSSTAYLARGSSGQSLFFTFNKPADAYAPGRFYANWGTVPAIIHVSDAKKPLNWYIKSPTGQTVSVQFGLPGDTITNSADFDLDGIDDFLSVRNGPGSARTWYSGLSSAGGGTFSTVFGEANDRVFTFLDNGAYRIGAVRVGSSGLLDWYSKSFFGTDVTSISWGLPGDIPLVPHDLDGDGQADYVVARAEGGIQTAYIRYANGSTATASLGLASSIPQIGNYFGQGNTFAWSQRDSGLVGLRDNQGGTFVVSFGISSNAIIRPDGTVVQPSETSKLGTAGQAPPAPSGGPSPSPDLGNAGSCNSTNAKGWLWKPASQDSGGSRQGRPLILFSKFSVGDSCLNVVAANGTIISKIGKYDSSRFYEGFGCGQRNTGSSLKDKAQAANNGSSVIYVQTPGGTCFGPISDPSSRVDKR